MFGTVAYHPPSCDGSAIFAPVFAALLRRGKDAVCCLLCSKFMDSAGRCTPNAIRHSSAYLSASSQLLAYGQLLTIALLLVCQRRVFLLCILEFLCRFIDPAGYFLLLQSVVVIFLSSALSVQLLELSDLMNHCQ